MGQQRGRGEHRAARMTLPTRRERQDGRVAVYRDEGVVLRTQKLGEADRIITLLTRRHGRVRAVAKGVRRTKRKFGARLEPFSHVDLQLYGAASSTSSPRPRPSTRSAAAWSATTRATPPARAMLETAERLTAEEREPALRLYLLLRRRRCARWPRRDARPARWCSTRSCCARWPSPAGRRRWASAPGAARRARTGAFSVRRRRGGVRRRAARPGRPRRAGRRSSCCGAAERRLGDRRRQRAAAPARGAAAWSRRYLQWHLERGLRSLPLVERA